MLSIITMDEDHWLPMTTVSTMTLEDLNNYSEMLEMRQKKLIKAKRHRSENVSERDKMLFLSILETRINVIENRKLGGACKMQMWREIEKVFNESAEVERTSDQLRELWKRLKIAMKKELEMAKQQKNFSPLPSSITRTFSLLKDFEFVDDVTSQGPQFEDDKACIPLLSDSVFENMKLSPLKKNFDPSTSSYGDNQERKVVFNPFHLTTLLVKSEDGKSLVERLADADVSFTATGTGLSSSGVFDSASLLNRIMAERGFGEETASFSERVAEFNNDDTVLQLQSSSPTVSNTSNSNTTSAASVNNGEETTDSSNELSGKLVIQNSFENEERQSSDPGSNFRADDLSEIVLRCQPVLSYPSSPLTRDPNEQSDSMTAPATPVDKSTSVPPMVTISSAAELIKLLPAVTQACHSEPKTSTVLKRGGKRRLLSDFSSPVSLSNKTSSELDSGIELLDSRLCEQKLQTEARLSKQRLQTEVEKRHLLKAQQHTEKLKAELLSALIERVKNGENMVSLDLLKVALS